MSSAEPSIACHSHCKSSPIAHINLPEPMRATLTKQIDHCQEHRAYDRRRQACSAKYSGAVVNKSIDAAELLHHDQAGRQEHDPARVTVLRQA